MTREEIDAMEAGREMDGAIAERVMGWQWRERPGAPSMLYAPDIDVAPVAERVEQPSRVEPLYSFSNVPHYSTDMAAAWQLAQHLLDDGYSMRLHGINTTTIGGGIEWVVDVTCGRGPCHKHGNKEYNWHGVVDVRANTAPLAICRAALKAAQP